MKNSIVCLVIAVLMAGCTVSAKTPNRVILENDRVILEDGPYHRNGNGNFCPPGQAKKGNC